MSSQTPQQIHSPYLCRHPVSHSLMCTRAQAPFQPLSSPATNGTGSGQKDSSWLSLFSCKGCSAVQACKWDLTGKTAQCCSERENTKCQAPTQWNYMTNHYVEPATNYLADEKTGFKRACCQNFRCVSSPIAC